MKGELKIGNELVKINVHRAYTDKDAAKIFNVEPQDIYDAVASNPGRFADGLVCKCEEGAPDGVRMLFPEKGMCMLATMLKSEFAETMVLTMAEMYVGMKEFVGDLERIFAKKHELESEEEEEEEDDDDDDGTGEGDNRKVDCDGGENIDTGGENAGAESGDGTVEKDEAEPAEK